MSTKKTTKQRDESKEYEAYCGKCKQEVAGSSGELVFMIEDMACPMCGGTTEIKEANYED
jgi:rRNA maturation endonuclease Nob1